MVLHRRSMGRDQRDDAGNVIQMNPRDRNGYVGIGCDGDDAWRLRIQKRFAVRLAMDLDHRVITALEAFHENEIHRAEPTEQVAQSGLGLLSELVHQCPASGGPDQDFMRPGLSMLPRVFPWRIDVEVVVGMLHGRDAETRDRKGWYQSLEQRRLSGAAPSSQANYPHLNPQLPAPSAPPPRYRGKSAMLKSYRRVHSRKDRSPPPPNSRLRRTELVVTSGRSTHCADVAQLVERQISNLNVASSNLVVRSSAYPR